MSLSPTTGSQPLGGSTTPRLERLKCAPRKPGEASFFWFETNFQSEAVKVLPGEYFVASEDLLIMTTLGSCIAACLWDRNARVGGLNHFLLPEGGADSDQSGRYGACAMELLIDEMVLRGASRSSLQAKVFGGGQVLAGMDRLNIGLRNTQFVLQYLKTERIAVVSKDVLGVYPRKVCFLPASGKAMVKRLALADAGALLAQECTTAKQATPPATRGGAADRF